MAEQRYPVGVWGRSSFDLVLINTAQAGCQPLQLFFLASPLCYMYFPLTTFYISPNSSRMYSKVLKNSNKMSTFVSTVRIKNWNIMSVFKSLLFSFPCGKPPKITDFCCNYFVFIYCVWQYCILQHLGFNMWETMSGLVIVRTEKTYHFRWTLLGKKYF